MCLFLCAGSSDGVVAPYVESLTPGGLAERYRFRITSLVLAMISLCTTFEAPCTVSEILSLIFQNLKRSRHLKHIPFGGSLYHTPLYSQCLASRISKISLAIQIAQAGGELCRFQLHFVSTSYLWPWLSPPLTAVTWMTSFFLS